MVELRSTRLPRPFQNRTPVWRIITDQLDLHGTGCTFAHPGEPVHLDVCVRIVVLEEARSGCSRPGCRGLVGKEKGAKMPKSKRPGCRGLGGQDAVGQDAVGQEAVGQDARG